MSHLVADSPAILNEKNRKGCIGRDSWSVILWASLHKIGRDFTDFRRTYQSANSIVHNDSITAHRATKMASPALIFAPRSVLVEDERLWSTNN
eukprot:1383478-Amorphochlora_amoeboformis.AAC.1